VTRSSAACRRWHCTKLGAMREGRMGHSDKVENGRGRAVAACIGHGGRVAMMQRMGGGRAKAARRGCWLPHGRPWGPLL
jgi:hypothetical protein